MAIEKKAYNFNNATKEELNAFVFCVEGSSDFETYDVGNYIEAIDYGLWPAQQLSWGVRHEHGTPEQREWIEDVFEEINYHTECRLLRNGDYEGFRERVAEGLYPRQPEVEISVPNEAILKFGKENTYFSMPCGKAGDYAYRVPNDKVEIVEYEAAAERRQRAHITLDTNEEVELRSSLRPTRTIPAEVLQVVLSDKGRDAYATSDVIDLSLPAAAYVGKTKDPERHKYCFKMPADGEYKGFTYEIDFKNAEPREDKSGKITRFDVRLPKKEMIWLDSNHEMISNRSISFEKLVQEANGKNGNAYKGCDRGAKEWPRTYEK